MPCLASAKYAAIQPSDQKLLGRSGHNWRSRLSFGFASAPNELGQRRLHQGLLLPVGIGQRFVSRHAVPRCRPHHRQCCCLTPFRPLAFSLIRMRPGYDHRAAEGRFRNRIAAQMARQKVSLLSEPVQGKPSITWTNGRMRIIRHRTMNGVLIRLALV
jgi:hypothetical protein